MLDLMFQVLKQVTVQIVLCIMLKQSSIFSPNPHQCIRGIKVYTKVNAGRLQYLLELPPGTVLCFCFIIFTRIFVLFTYFSNLHVPTPVSYTQIRAHET